MTEQVKSEERSTETVDNGLDSNETQGPYEAWGEADRKLGELAMQNGISAGRVRVATAVKSILRGLMHSQELPGQRKPTKEEQKIWDYVTEELAKVDRGE